MRPIRLTPQHLVTAARILLPLIMAALSGAICLVDCSPAIAAFMTFAAALIVMQAAPRIRAADLLGGLAAFVTLLEWVRAADVGEVSMSRWLGCIGVSGAVVLLLKVQHVRALARQDAYVPLRQLERRTTVFGRTIPGRGYVPVRRDN